MQISMMQVKFLNHLVHLSFLFQRKENKLHCDSKGTTLSACVTPSLDAQYPNCTQKQLNTLNCSGVDIFERNLALLLFRMEGYAAISSYTKCLVPCKRNVYSVNKIMTVRSKSMKPNLLMPTDPGETFLIFMKEQTKTMTR
jgi:hypothetical protein